MAMGHDTSIAEQGQCPESVILQKYLLGNLPGAEFDAVEMHVSSCHRCSEVISDAPQVVDELTSHLRRLPSTPDFGDFELIMRLGDGGMGHVYRARHRVLGQDFALKIVHPRLQDDSHFLARFEREIEVLGQLNSPYVVQSVHAGTWKGTPFVVMELVDGNDLATLVRQREVFSSPNSAEAVAQVALGLSAIHEQGLVHRDIHPGNVLLSRQGQIKIGDLGLAKAAESSEEIVGLTDARDRIGADAFTAPEQRLRPDSVTPKADVFSLGCLWYFLLTGRSVPRTPLTHEVSDLARCLRSVPRGCRRLIAQMLANEPEHRPECAVVTRSLRHLRRSSRLSDLYRKRPQPSGLKQRTAVAAGIATLAVLIAGAAFVTLSPSGADENRYHPMAPRNIELPYKQGGSLVRRFHFEAAPGPYTLELVDSHQELLSKGALATWWYLDNVDADESTRIAITERSPRPSVTIELRPGTHKVSAMSVRADPDLQVVGQETRLIDHVGVMFFVYPDLAVRDLHISSERLHIQQPAYVDFELVNLGTVDTTPGVIRAFLNPEEPSFLSGQCAELPCFTMTPGATERVRLPIEIPDDFPTGPACVSIYADASNTTQERDELSVMTWRDGKANDFNFMPKNDPKGPIPENNRASIAIQILSQD